MNRIKDSIGDLMTDEDLRKIMERGVEKALFQPRDGRDGYGYTRSKESLVDEAVHKFLEQQMQAAVDKWVDSNADKLKEAVDKAIVLGAGECAIRAMDSRMNTALYELGQRMNELATRVSH